MQTRGGLAGPIGTARTAVADREQIQYRPTDRPAPAPYMYFTVQYGRKGEGQYEYTLRECFGES